MNFNNYLLSALFATSLSGFVVASDEARIQSFIKKSPKQIELDVKLYVAAVNLDQKAVEEFLAQGADPNVFPIFYSILYVGPNQKTLIEQQDIEFKMQQKEILKKFLSHGMNVNNTENYGHLAKITLSQAKAIVESRLLFSTVAPHGTPLHILCKEEKEALFPNRKINSTMLKFFGVSATALGLATATIRDVDNKFGAKIIILGILALKSFDAIVKWSSFKPSYKEDDIVDFAKILLNHNPDLSARDNQGKTPLDLAVKGGKMEKLLLEHAANSSTPTTEPLFKAKL